MIYPIRLIVIFLKIKDFSNLGAMDIPLYDKSGKVVATLDKAPMIDFSSNARTGFATLAFPQYIVSVKHNTGYKKCKIWLWR
nr:Serine protease pic autotransporter precursor [Escherichia coli]